MSDDLYLYHRKRAEQCRVLAQQATDPDVRRCHEQLAALHTDRASVCAEALQPVGELSAA